jgi:SsrA-binding protein
VSAKFVIYPERPLLWDAYLCKLPLIMASGEISISSNKKASFEYHIDTKYEAGLVLTGTEIKSVRKSQVNLSDAYCVFMNEELWVKGMHIAEYKEGSYNNHLSKRDRKLLLNRTELKKLRSRVKEKGYSIIPLRIYITEKGFAKLEIALARGKNVRQTGRYEVERCSFEMSRAKKRF